MLVDGAAVCVWVCGWGVGRRRRRRRSASTAKHLVVRDREDLYELRLGHTAVVVLVKVLEVVLQPQLVLLRFVLELPYHCPHVGRCRRLVLRARGREQWRQRADWVDACRHFATRRTGLCSRAAAMGQSGHGFGVGGGQGSGAPSGAAAERRRWARGPAGRPCRRARPPRRGFAESPSAGC